VDLIKESKGIHKCLLKRWEELELKNSQIIKDAEERGMILTKSNMTNYRKSDPSIGITGLTQKQVLWLALRYFVPVQIQLGVPEIVKGEIQYSIPKFDELQAIKNLNKHKALFK
jgi:hypothetical protein